MLTIFANCFGPRAFTGASSLDSTVGFPLPEPLGYYSQNWNK